MKATMSDLAEDLVEEILCRVPATSLKRLRSSCKRWNRLYKDSKFARKQVDKAAKQFVPLMLTKDFRFCSLSINLQGTPSVEVERELTQLRSHSNSAQTKYIRKVFYCDGLLLCTTEDESAIAVWNPLTDERRWIQAGKRIKTGRHFVLGYSHDNKSGIKSYKILSFCHITNRWEIYEFKSDSWRSVDDKPRSWWVICTDCGVSLKGNNYWFARDVTYRNLGISLLRFDFSAEKFESVSLPCPYQSLETSTISVVREEKLSVLLKLENALKTEVWVTNTIDETNVVSWSKVLSLDLSTYLQIPSISRSFLLDEEKKVIVCCERMIYYEDSGINRNDIVYIVGEDNKVTPVDFGVATSESCRPAIFNYVPSLVEIKSGGGKRKRGED